MTGLHRDRAGTPLTGGGKNRQKIGTAAADGEPRTVDVRSEPPLLREGT